MDNHVYQRMEERAEGEQMPKAMREAIERDKTAREAKEAAEKARVDAAVAAHNAFVEQATAAQRAEAEMAQLAAEKRAADERKAKRDRWEASAKLNYLRTGGTEEGWAAVADDAWAEHLRRQALDGPTVEQERTASFAEMLGLRRL